MLDKYFTVFGVFGLFCSKLGGKTRPHVCSQSLLHISWLAGCYLGHQDNFLSPPYHIRQFIIKFRKRFFAAAAGLVNSRHWAFASYFSSSGCVGPFSKFARPRGSPSASKLDRDAVNRRQWPYQILTWLGDCKLQWGKTNSRSSR